MDYPMILPRLDERATFCGATGSGKTHGELLLAGQYYGHRQIILLDTKADKGIKKLDAVVSTTLRGCAKFKDKPLCIYRPNGAELGNPYVLDAFCQWVYERKNTLLIIDEGTQLNKSGHTPLPGFLNMYTRGRSREVSVWLGTQRPVGLPTIVFSEAEWVYQFNLRTKKDRITVASYTSDSMLQAIPDKHGVRIFNVDLGVRYAKDIQEAMTWKE
ncbi:MAG: P-loop NTPase family protein [Thermoplasmataceae archaeon]